MIDEITYIPTINEQGESLLRRWLASHHKNPQSACDCLHAWLDEAEGHALSPDQEAYIELRSWESVSGHTETLTLPSNCVTWTRVPA